MSNEPIPPEVSALLKEIRSYLANSGDAWERRRELIVNINQFVEGGEVDLFVGTVREMSRVGASYTTLVQTLAQLNTNAAAAANLTNMLAQTMPTGAFLMPNMFGASMPGMPNTGVGMPGTGAQPTVTPPLLPGFDYFRMVSDFLNAQATTARAAAASASVGEPAAAPGTEQPGKTD